MNPEKREYFKNRLLTMRDAIQSLDSVRRSGSDVVELDQTRTGRLSRMDAMQMQAMAKTGRQRAELELRRIDAALARIDNGVFGDCAACEEPISEGRLEANPANLLCLSCASARES